MPIIGMTISECITGYSFHLLLQIQSILWDAKSGDIVSSLRLLYRDESCLGDQSWPRMKGFLWCHFWSLNSPWGKWCFMLLSSEASRGAALAELTPAPCCTFPSHPLASFTLFHSVKLLPTHHQPIPYSLLFVFFLFSFDSVNPCPTLPRSLFLNPLFRPNLQILPLCPFPNSPQMFLNAA